MNRRNFLFLTTLLFSKNLLIGKTLTHNVKGFSYMEEESKRHKRTWMAFVANDYIWSSKQISEVKKDLAFIIKTIAKYEPVSVLVNSNDKKEMLKLLDGVDGHKFPIEVFEFPIDDLWMRDTAPTFVTIKNGLKGGIDFNFNGWGKKQEHFFDSKVAKFVSQQAKTKLIQSNLVLEGGSFEVDGMGTAILTESSVLNPNRNPNVSKKEFEKELKKLLGLKKIIWLKGIKNKDITDAHVDFYARFTKPGTVVVSRENDSKSYDYDITRENIKILQNAIDAKGDKLEIIVIDNPKYFNESFGVDDFAAGYIGYYVCNDAVIMQKFGDDKADANAYKILQEQFPTRVIEQISIDAIASGGGTIHCATQQEPV